MGDTEQRNGHYITEFATFGADNDDDDDFRSRVGDIFLERTLYQ